MQVVKELTSDIITYEDLYNQIDDIFIFGLSKDGVIWCTAVNITDLPLTCIEVGGDVVFSMYKSSKSLELFEEFLNDQKAVYAYRDYEEYHKELLNFICDVWEY